MSKPIRLLEFGDFCLDTNQRILLRAGKRLALSQKPFALLLLLVENRHRIVSKDELMEQVWPGVVVEETNITTNISRLRRLLAEGDHGKENGQDNGRGESQPFIETVSGIGYQFVADVHEREVVAVANLAPAATEPPATPITELPSSPNSSSRSHALSRRRYGYALAILVLASLAGALFWYLTPRSQPPFSDPAKLRPREIVGWKNREGNDRLLIRVSPDGKMIAYSKSEAGHADIFIKAVEGGQESQITSDEGPDFDPIWSPDGTELAYLSSRGNTHEVSVFESRTRQRKVVRTFGSDYLRLRSWSKQARKIYYTNDKNLFTLDLDTQQITNLTNFNEANSTASDFSPSPDEESVVYIQPVDKARRVFVAALDGSQPRQLTFTDDNPAFPTWFGDSQYILYGSKNGDSRQLSVVSVKGGNPVQVHSSHETMLPYQISADGKRIFYAISREEADLYRHDLTTATETPLVSDAKLKLWPEVSSDGKTLVFQRFDTMFNLTRSQILLVPAAAGATPIKVANEGFDPHWSPRTGQLAYLQPNNQLWLYDSQSGIPQQLTNEPVLSIGFISHQPYEWRQPRNYSWAPDGSRLAYCTSKDKVMNIRTVTVRDQQSANRSNNTDPKLKLSTPLWSPDGNRIAYLAQTTLANLPGQAARSVLISVLINDGQQDQTIFRTEERLRMIGWTPDGNHFLVGMMNSDEADRPGTVKLYQIALTGNQPEMLGELKNAYLFSLRLSPDGKKLAFTVRQAERDNVWLYSLADGRSRPVTTNLEPHLHFNGLSWLPDSKGLYFSKLSGSTSIYALENFH
jgi:Tol biopolymer transport system component/DNA-binding winged helix-turn-helix (wHTH) protein